MAIAMYERRAILFLDILGFKKLIQERREDLLLGALDVPRSLRDRYPFDGRTEMKISAFSDSIAISEVVKDDHIGVLRLAGYANYMWWKFLCKGVLTRGGLAVGELYHKDGILFGPAMNEAFELESQLAIYPRIVISEKVHQQLLQEVFNEHKGHPSMALFGLDLVRHDFDGIRHIHVLGSTGPIPEEILAKKAVNPETGGASFDSVEIIKAKSEIVSRLLLDRPKERRVIAKYDWLKNYLNESNNARVP